jgi:hypothetical protein
LDHERWDAHFRLLLLEIPEQRSALLASGLPRQLLQLLCSLTFCPLAQVPVLEILEAVATDLEFSADHWALFLDSLHNSVISRNEELAQWRHFRVLIATDDELSLDCFLARRRDFLHRLPLAVQRRSLCCIAGFGFFEYLQKIASLSAIRAQALVDTKIMQSFMEMERFLAFVMDCDSDSTFFELKAVIDFLFFLLSTVRFMDLFVWPAASASAIRDRILDALEVTGQEVLLMYIKEAKLRGLCLTRSLKSDA